MSTPTRSPCQWLISLAVSGLTLCSGSSRAAETCLPPPTTDAQCLECHQAKIEQELTKPFVHQPFREKKCIICHLGGELTTPVKSAFKAEQKITWLADSPLASTEHWFPLPKNKISGDIQLDIMVADRGVFRGVIEAQDFSGLPEMPPDKTPPVLSGIKVDSIEKGVLLSATISWLTDELADTRIAYGSGKLDTTSYIAEMSRAHRITIGGLSDATEYQFQVGSADYLGNLAQGAITTFSTSGATKPPPGRESATMPSRAEPTWDRRIYQDSPAGMIILQVTTTTPSKVAVGTLSEIAPEKNADLGPGARKKPCQHQLKTVLETTINVCIPCHEFYVKSGTRHPLQVGPKSGMVFPPELFVLADGGIHCMTCHSAHSSVYPNRLVKPGKEELCRGCHTDK